MKLIVIFEASCAIVTEYFVIDRFYICGSPGKSFKPNLEEFVLSGIRAKRAKLLDIFNLLNCPMIGARA